MAMTLFGKKVAHLRDQKKLRNKDIAEKTRLKPSEVTKIIKGELQKIEKIRAILDTLPKNPNERSELIVEWLLDRLLELDRGQNLVEIHKAEETSDVVKKITACPLPDELKKDLFYIVDDALQHAITRRQIHIWTELIRSQQKRSIPVGTKKKPSVIESSRRTKSRTYLSKKENILRVAEEPKQYSKRSKRISKKEPLIENSP